MDMDKPFNSASEMLDAIIGEDIQNQWLDIYEQETGLEPVPEDGGHTEDFEEWLVSNIENAFNFGMKTLKQITSYFNLKRMNEPDHSDYRTNELCKMIADYGINGAGNDETYEQKVFGAQCVEIALRLMRLALLEDISDNEGETIYTEQRLLNEWNRLRREAFLLRK